jgi:hypothetical protein
VMHHFGFSEGTTNGPLHHQPMLSHVASVYENIHVTALVDVWHAAIIPRHRMEQT